MHADAEKQFCKRACEEAFVVWGRGGVVLTFLRRRSEAVTGNGNPPSPRQSTCSTICRFPREHRLPDSQDKLIGSILRGSNSECSSMRDLGTTAYLTQEH